MGDSSRSINSFCFRLFLYFDFNKKEIYKDIRNLDVPDNYQFVVALAETMKTLKTEKERRNFMNALIDCEYYGKQYLPENISIGDTNSPSWKIFLFSISSLIISYQRVDAEENLKPEYVKDIRDAFGKYNSGLYRSLKSTVRSLITTPTIPLIIPVLFTRYLCFEQMGVNRKLETGRAWLIS